jgi:hypothetical protein
VFAVYRTDRSGVFESEALITDTSLAQVTVHMRALAGADILGPRAYLVHLGAQRSEILARWRTGDEGFWGPVTDRERAAIGSPDSAAA